METTKNIDEADYMVEVDNLDIGFPIEKKQIRKAVVHKFPYSIMIISII